MCAEDRRVIDLVAGKLPENVCLMRTSSVFRKEKSMQKRRTMTLLCCVAATQEGQLTVMAKPVHYPLHIHKNNWTYGL